MAHDEHGSLDPTLGLREPSDEEHELEDLKKMLDEEDVAENAGSSEKGKQTDTDTEAVEAPKKRKKGVNPVLKLMVGFMGLAVLGVGGAAAYMSVGGGFNQTNAQFQPVDLPARPAIQTKPAVGTTQPASVQPQAAGAYSAPAAQAQPVQVPVFTMNTGTGAATGMPSHEPGYSNPQTQAGNEHARATQLGGLAHREGNDPLPLSEGSSAAHVSLLNEMNALKNEFNRQTAKFNEFDSAATVLHQTHGDQLRYMKDALREQSKVILEMQKEMQRLAEVVSTQKAGGSDAKLIARVEKLEKTAELTEKHEKDMKWVSYTRMCEVEKSLGISRWASYCGFDAKEAANEVITGNSPVPVMTPVQPAGKGPQESVSAEVPATVGGFTSPSMPLGVQSMVPAAQSQNPCSYASKEWKLAMLSDSSAMIVRLSDGYRTLLEMHSPVPGLGRVQMFVDRDYPQYIQFTNGIICGG
ncbi:hypothetical protein [Marinobacterium stanieri]|uniref:Uncharacterized protein n=1 Tax=Marinobacterium stanieri TaxID=49186 RepID=A0A1N6XAU6_9GAMM|nr:hypothetical protein [Marinobacterium stanieri]SIQ99390.1 hypothetical protein SAMN05421647_11352 [Marinobacterium stanieri]